MAVETDPRFRGDLERLAADAGLCDFDALMEYDGYFDELPLFATFSAVAFLDGLEPRERDRVLVRAAVAHLGRILGHAERHYAGREPDFFCAVTVTGWDLLAEGDPLVPRFWRANPSRGVFDHLELAPPAGAGSRMVADFLDRDPDYLLNDDIVPEAGGRRLERVFVQHIGHPVPRTGIGADSGAR